MLLYALIIFILWFYITIIIIISILFSAMVRSYKKKTDRKLPSPSTIRKGLELLKSGYSLRIAAKESGLNYGILNRVNKKQNNLNGAMI